MALVNRQKSTPFLFPSKLSPSLRIHRSTDSSSSQSSLSSSPSTYSFTRTSGESSQISEASCSTASTPSCPVTFLGPSKTRTSCLSEFCCNCDDYHCTLSRRAHIRRRPKLRIIRPLPQVPKPARPLPRPTGVRKLPPLPSRPQHASQRTHLSSVSDHLTSLKTDTLARHRKPPSLTWEPHFTPEIDWDAIMVEIIRENSRENDSDYYYYSDDAESIYTDFVYDE
ncbi:hypothetical protein DFH05DRAFT_1525621 [Lentinula detonsa]|uniref:Uncharacterized protein n=1 Tax=Lentinula detonsa TaxID=2804962 RepID=A0A9W8NYG7_9AGAR|nr:hypothetical protein DFH05DRAFT_1525621 [Lentinula detonsa]